MCVSDCEEGQRLLQAATEPNPGSMARDAFLEHIKHCSLCNPHGIADGFGFMERPPSQ